MTDCTHSPLTFASLGRRNITANFDGGAITSDGGTLLLREVDRRIGLTAAMADAVSDPRDPAKITHDLLTLIRQRVFALAAGYEDGNDHQRLRHDPMMQILTEQPADPDQPLASPPTLCRMENAVTHPSLTRLSAVFVEQFLASHQGPPEQIILDFDATDARIHGQQEGRFFHGYYDHYCFLPLYVFCGDQLLCAYLRPSRIDAAKHSRAILKLLVERIRQAWPATKIIFRADSGFCRWKTLRWCDRYGVGYIVGLAQNKVLLREAQPWTVPAAIEHQRTGEKVRWFGTIGYAAGTWDRVRRVIVKAEHGEQGPNPRFVVTNLPGDPQVLYDELYCQRGEMENRIKEQQLHLFADRTSCHAFAANQFRLLLSAAAYVLLETLRRVGLRGTSLARAQCDTIRLKLLKIGARVRVSVRRVVLHLASGYPLAGLLRTVLTRLAHLRPVPL